MEGVDSSSGLYRPHLEAESRSVDETLRAVEVQNVDRCEPIQEMDDSQLVGVPVVVAENSVVGGGETPAAVKVEVETVARETEKDGVKKKRGRPPRDQAKPPQPKRRKEEEEEDVCFICFDGGSLVLCDRKGCPKAYHPACIKRDEAFFRSKAKWNCGWHICSVCRKASHYMCYTCTFSLCKGCTKDADYVCVRGNKGFCTTCMRTIMLIENNEPGNNEMVQVDFDDKSSWEYLFKVYWIYLKRKLSLTLNELTQAKNPWKATGMIRCKAQSFVLHYNTKGSKGSISDKSSENLEASNSDKTNELLMLLNKDSLSTETPGSDKGASLICSSDWASKELLEFIAHMKNGDTSVLYQFDVQALLLDYIKRNNLRDPHRKGQIICDLRLKNLFGKPRVGHIEMLKLLEFHFLIKEDSQKNGFIPAGIVDAVASHVEPDGNNDNLLMMGRDKRRRTRRKNEARAPQTNLDEYAAIDVHNINLIFLRRNLMESLIGNTEKFHDKVVGSIVRIRISGGDQKQDMYRLVQVVGTSKVAVPYKLGDKTTDVMLELLNLDKKEAISIDAISNQAFSEDECRRLRQSIKCGLVKRFTVGEIQEKAMSLQTVTLHDRLETEILRLNYLRDRASEKGHKKDLRECIEKLQLLKTPEERQRRLSEIPEVHADPRMDPNYESEEDTRELIDKKQDEYVRPRFSGFSRNVSKPVAPQKRGKVLMNNGGKTWKNLTTCKDSNSEGPTKAPEIGGSNSSEQLENWVDSSGSAVGGNQAVMSSQWFSGVASENSAIPLSTEDAPSVSKSETDKLWHYRDPNGGIQGPFSMVQLRKWSTTGLFPPDMRIWVSDEQVDSILLTDALNGQFHKALPILFDISLKSQEVGMHSQCWESLKGNNSCSDQPQVHSPLPSSIIPGQPDVLLMQQGSSRECETEKSGPNHENWNSHGTKVCQSTVENSREKECNSQTYSGQSSGQNWRSLNNLDSNLGFASVTKSINSSEQNGDMDIANLPSPTPKTINREWEGQAAENKQSVSSDVPVQDVSVLPSPTPKPCHEDQNGQTAETKQSVLSNFPIQDSGPTWSSASSLVVGGAQLPEVANEWGARSPAAKPSTKEWDSGLGSVSSSKQPEMAAVTETIEFSTLAEESVSDLLAEVDAMESRSGLASPTSAMDYGEELIQGSKNDCFSSIEELSPTPDLGKSDAFSSTGDMQLSCQSRSRDDPVVASRADIFYPVKSCSGQSSTSDEVDGERKTTHVPVNSGKADSYVPSPAPSTRKQHMVGIRMVQSAGLEAMETDWRTMQGNVNMGWGGSPQGIGNMGWNNNQMMAWGNTNNNHGALAGSLMWDGQRKYTGERFIDPRETAFQGDSGYNRGRPSWNRQSFVGGGGAYSRPPPKGQRVCKFFENGHCKKGEFCDYLHP
ncbi:unnamed protein product [Ilex paraguariensis]|uniref:Zinc finger CCCH domain-containing protein 44 n=1 Tax=Ilex paraguariensis TaxID=185542 RepID=A0ABC8SIN6_9AQUA